MFPFKKLHLKMPSATWRLFCFVLNVWSEIDDILPRLWGNRQKIRNNIKTQNILWDTKSLQNTYIRWRQCLHAMAEYTVRHYTQNTIVTWPSKGHLRGILKVPLPRHGLVVKAWLASLSPDFPCRALRYTCVIHVAQCILAGKQTLPSHPTRQWSADNLISGIH